MAEASSPTGEVAALDARSSGGWKPITAYSLRRHSGSGLSGNPPSEPFNFLKRATRFIISSRDHARTCLQSFIDDLLHCDITNERCRESTDSKQGTAYIFRGGFKGRFREAA